MSVDDFLEARLADDTELPPADRESKQECIRLFRLVGEAPGIHRDAWHVMKMALHALAKPYSDHPDYAAIPTL